MHLPPLLALLLCVVFIAWLFWLDLRQRQATSPAIWIPAAWLAIIGSRPVAYWLPILGLGSAGGGDVEGNPINLVVLAGLIFAALFVLQQRSVNWLTIIRSNKALFILYAFFALSALWSEYSLASFKRILKDFGSVLAVLVLLTEEDPLAAIRIVFVRVSYLLLPLSVVLIKYFPAVGRGKSRAGDAMFTGVTTQKNSLGQMVFVFGLVILLDLLLMRQEQPNNRQRVHRAIRYGLLLMGLWLLKTCQSRTSLVCLVFGAMMIWAGYYLIRLQQPKKILLFCITAGLCVVALDAAFDISQNVLQMLGRNPTLTGRTDIWRTVLAQPINPLFGCGYLTFWDGPMGQAVVEELTNINTSHNGYLEIYLDGGWIGVSLLVIMLLAAGHKTAEDLLTGSSSGKVAFAFWALALVYNFSESSFFRLGPLWFALLLFMLRCPQPALRPAILASEDAKEPLPLRPQQASVQSTVVPGH